MKDSVECNVKLKERSIFYHIGGNFALICVIGVFGWLYILLINILKIQIVYNIIGPMFFISLLLYFIYMFHTNMVSVESEMNKLKSEIIELRNKEDKS